MTQARTTRLETLADCALAIGGYPRFGYDARGGGGVAEAGEADGEGRRPLRFDTGSLVIPPLSWRTARFLGLPLPPGLSIGIVPERLEGHLHPPSGALTLRFSARFRFTIAGLYRAPDLVVDTVLSTGVTQGDRHRSAGRPLDDRGHAVLVGVAPIAPSGDARFDRFLGLPDEALAVLHCRLGPTVLPGQAVSDAAPPA
jgi:hypothetical protein